MTTCYSITKGPFFVNVESECDAHCSAVGKVVCFHMEGPEFDPIVVLATLISLVVWSRNTCYTLDLFVLLPLKYL